MKILIDNGHGRNTAGKRSPDGRFREYAYTRLIARYVCAYLKYKGYDAELLVPEEEDISLNKRAARVNAYCGVIDAQEICLISIHVNAAGNGDQWHNTTGWCAYTSKGQTAGDILADSLYAVAEAALPGHCIRRDFFDGDADIESNFYLLRHTLCPAVLTENGFMDCEESLCFLESTEGMRAIVDLHVNGILSYISNM